MATQTLSNDDIIEAIGNLSVVELAELIEKFKEKFGVTIAAPVAAAPAAGGGAAGGAAGAAAAEEKTEFTVILKGAGRRRSRSSKRSERSPTWASRRPRTWWKARPAR